LHQDIDRFIVKTPAVILPARRCQPVTDLFPVNLIIIVLVIGILAGAAYFWGIEKKL
jgi:hypothetical protein